MLPRISVVTCSYNQGRFLGRTIDSVLAQDYPAVEHIVVDGLSTDETPQILSRSPHLRVVRERDSGQAEAINKGFRLASGDIFCFLNSDDTLLPGALHRVAREIDPNRGRHVVVGRCNYIDENDVFTGLEHPSRPVGHRRILQVWKTHCVPQPATFWTRAVWRECGPLDESLPLALDYDLFCRFSRRYRFHFIDAVLANYRLHGQSKSCTNPEDDIRELATELSRRYWGSALLPKYWLLQLSLAWDRFAREHNPLRRARQAPPHGLRLRRRLWLAAVMLLAPRVSLRRCLPRRLQPLWDRLFERRSRSDGLWHRPTTRPETLIYRNFTGLHHEGTIGPVYETDFILSPGQDALYLEAEEVVSPMPGPFEVEVSVDGRPVHLYRHNHPGPISLVIPLCGLPPGRHRLAVRSSSAVTLYDWTWVEDHRPLSLRLRRLEPITSGQVAFPTLPEPL
jgi:glycosyltransferase involved in cell wall biosynthesis